jgi:septum site-determining protein MinC
MKAVKLKGTSEGLYLITDMSYDKRKVEEDLIEIVKEAEKFLGSSREVFVLLDNSAQEDDDMGFLENLLGSLGIKINKSKSESFGDFKVAQEQQKDIYTEGNTLLIRKNIRSGQKIEHIGTIVIIGDVNPGAEIKAGGHVIIIGSLKGNVHAGASGDEQAVIYANKFAPNIIKIAGLIAKAPESEKGIESEAEIARIYKKHIIIENI